MRSKFEKLKERAVGMRKRGASLRDVAKRLGIPKSTLNYWFRDVQLSDFHRQRLRKRHEMALTKARVEAVKWHNAQKAARLRMAAIQAAETIAKIDLTNDATAELALALLYLGEGAEKSSTALGNSDPRIVRFFVTLLQRLYGVPLSSIRCDLHLRADQDPEQMIRFWSSTLRAHQITPPCLRSRNFRSRNFVSTSSCREARFGLRLVPRLENSGSRLGHPGYLMGS